MPRLDEAQKRAREARLPRWAQDELNDARRKVAEAVKDRDAARLATNPDETDTVVDPYGDPPIGLPKSRNVRFKLGNNGHDWIDVRVDSDGETIHVLGSTRLRIDTSASNVINVGIHR